MNPAAAEIYAGHAPCGPYNLHLRPSLSHTSWNESGLLTSCPASNRRLHEVWPPVPQGPDPDKVYYAEHSSTGTDECRCGIPVRDREECNRAQQGYYAAGLSGKAYEVVQLSGKQSGCYMLWTTTSGFDPAGVEYNAGRDGDGTQADELNYNRVPLCMRAESFVHCNDADGNKCDQADFQAKTWSPGSDVSAMGAAEGQLDPMRVQSGEVVAVECHHIRNPTAEEYRLAAGITAITITTATTKAVASNAETPINERELIDHLQKVAQTVRGLSVLQIGFVPRSIMLVNRIFVDVSARRRFGSSLLRTLVLDYGIDRQAIEMIHLCGVSLAEEETEAVVGHNVWSHIAAVLDQAGGIGDKGPELNAIREEIRERMRAFGIEVLGLDPDVVREEILEHVDALSDKELELDAIKEIILKHMHKQQEHQCFQVYGARILNASTEPRRVRRDTDSGSGFVATVTFDDSHSAGSIDGQNVGVAYEGSKYYGRARVVLVSGGGGNDNNEDGENGTAEIIAIVVVSAVLATVVVGNMMAKRRRIDAAAARPRANSLSVDFPDKVDLRFDHPVVTGGLDASGLHPIHYAAMSGSVSVVSQILDGCPPRTTGRDALTNPVYGIHQVPPPIREKPERSMVDRLTGGSISGLTRSLSYRNSVASVRSLAESSFDLPGGPVASDLPVTVAATAVAEVRSSYAEAGPTFTHHQETSPIYGITTHTTKFEPTIGTIDAVSHPLTKIKETVMPFASCDSTELEISIGADASATAVPTSMATAERTASKFGAAASSEARRISLELMALMADTAVDTPKRPSEGTAELMQLVADLPSADLTSSMAPLSVAAAAAAAAAPSFPPSKTGQPHPSTRIPAPDSMPSELSQPAFRVDELLDLPDRKGNSPLMWAVRLSQENVTRFLLGRGADTSRRNAHQATALHLASMLNVSTAIVELLVQAKADPNELDGDGNSPLIHAASNGNLRTVATVLRAGGSVTISNYRGITPLIAAAIGKHVRLLQELAVHPTARLAAQDQSGRTVLHWACALGLSDAVEPLLRKNTDLVLVETEAGETACFTAIKCDNGTALAIMLRLASVKERITLLTTEDAVGHTLYTFAVERRAKSCLAVLTPHLKELPENQELLYPGLSSSLIPGNSPPLDRSDMFGAVDTALSSSPGDAGAVAEVRPVKRKRAKPKGEGRRCSSDSSGSASGDPAPKQTIDQARERRRNYMRQKRAEEIQVLKRAEAQVEALELQSQQLAATKAALIQEATQLRLNTGMPPYHLIVGTGTGTPAPTTNIEP